MPIQGFRVDTLTGDTPTSCNQERSVFRGVTPSCMWIFAGTPEYDEVMYAAWAPPGVAKIEDHITIGFLSEATRMQASASQSQFTNRKGVVGADNAPTGCCPVASSTKHMVCTFRAS